MKEKNPSWNACCRYCCWWQWCARAFGTKKKLVSVLNGKIPRYLQCFWTTPTAKTLVFMQFSACCKKPFFHAKVTKPCTLHLKLLRHGFQILKRTVAWTIYQGLSLQARRQYKSTLHWSIFAFRTLLKRQKPMHYKSKAEPNRTEHCKEMHEPKLPMNRTGPIEDIKKRNQTET